MSLARCVLEERSNRRTPSAVVFLALEQTTRSLRLLFVGPRNLRVGAPFVNNDTLIFCIAKYIADLLIFA